LVVQKAEVGVADPNLRDGRSQGESTLEALSSIIEAAVRGKRFGEVGPAVGGGIVSTEGLAVKSDR
jgi:hypothetical protein